MELHSELKKTSDPSLQVEECLISDDQLNFDKILNCVMLKIKRIIYKNSKNLEIFWEKYPKFSVGELENLSLKIFLHPNVPVVKLIIWE